MTQFQNVRKAYDGRGSRVEVSWKSVFRLQRSQRPIRAAAPPSAPPGSHAMGRARVGGASGDADPPARKRRRRSPELPRYADEDDSADEDAALSSSCAEDGEHQEIASSPQVQPQTQTLGETSLPEEEEEEEEAAPSSPPQQRPPSPGSSGDASDAPPELPLTPPADPPPTATPTASDAPISSSPPARRAPVRSAAFASTSACAGGCEGSCCGGASGSDSLRARIRAITANKRMTASERDRARQQLYMAHYQRTQTTTVDAFRARLRARQYAPTWSSVVDPQTGARLHGCEHYARKCKIRAACCGVWVGCRHCHDMPALAAGHLLDRFAVREVLCMLCGRVQPAGAACANAACGVRFARYYCERCNFYDDDPKKDIYHCEKCDICRLGKAEDFFHCDTCNACVQAGAGSGEHRCLAGSLDGDCPVCAGGLRASTTPVVFVQCGHAMHLACFDEYVRHRHVCPLCSAALTDLRPWFDEIEREVAAQALPDEFEGRRLEVLCHDCDRRSVTPFHFTYYKCQLCRGYNTRVIKERERGEEVRVLPVARGRTDRTEGTGEPTLVGTVQVSVEQNSEERERNGQHGGEAAFEIGPQAAEASGQSNGDASESL